VAGSPSELVQGTADVLILKAASWGPTHGFGISRWLRETTNGQLGLEGAGLYQALHRLETRGWLASEWGLSANNRRAKYYRLTPLGRRQLRSRTTTWRAYADAVGRVLDARTNEAGR
jgi:transcriptional regulator